MAAAPEPMPQPLSGDELYDLRRDAEGKSYTTVATEKVPPSPQYKQLGSESGYYILE